MAINIESHPYGPESTPQEVEALKKRVYLQDNKILFFKEAPIQSIFQLDLFFDKIEKLTENLESFNMIIDLTEAHRPSADIRLHLRTSFASLHKLKHVGIFTGKNRLINIAARFVMHSLGLQSYSIHNTIAEAEREIDGKEKI